jgi:NitT/TauT family transport system substrate-binding protein
MEGTPIVKVGRAHRLTAVTVSTLLLAASCASRQPAAARPLDKVTYVTGFGTFGRDSYAWLAAEKGYFREAGLSVTIQPGTGTENNLKALNAGRAQFATLDFSAAIVHIGKTGDTGFRAVAAIQQRTVVAIMTLTGTGITRPADLPGHTIAETGGAASKTLFPAYAQLAGIDPDKVHWIDATPQQLPALLAAGRVDAIGQFVVGAPAIEQAAGGRRAITLPYSDYLTDLYGNVLVTPTALTTRSPDLVRRFSTALMKGLGYAIAHPDEAGQILHRAQPTTDAVTAAAEVRLMASYVTSASTGIPVGALDPTRVMRAIAILQAVGLIPAGLVPDHVADFTLSPKAA